MDKEVRMCETKLLRQQLATKLEWTLVAYTNQTQTTKPDHFILVDMSIYHDESCVLKNVGIWADEVHVPKDELENRLTWKDSSLVSLKEAGVNFDENDKPINPYDTSNLKLGRHFLGRWGPNHAADPIITSDGPFFWSPKYVLVIKRVPQKDTPEDRLVALPGGMVDAGEDFLTAAFREAFEEAIRDDDMLLKKLKSSGTRMYSGYAHDPRCTRNAWIETTTYHAHLTWKEASCIGIKYDGVKGETTSAFWMPLVYSRVKKMYSHHPDRVEEVINAKQWSYHYSLLTHAICSWIPYILPIFIAYWTSTWYDMYTVKTAIDHELNTSVSISM